MFGIGVDPQGDSPVVLAKLAAHIAERATADSAGRLLRDADAATAAEADALSAEIAAHGALTFFAGSGCAQALGARGVCAAGEVLRRWLFALPEPLLSFSMYDSFLLADTVADAGDRVLVLRTLLAHLARGYRAATRGLLALLSRLCDVSTATATTTPEALSAALWPVLLRPAEACFYMRDDEPAARRVVAALVAEGDGLWKTVSVGAGHRLVSRQKPSDPGLPFPPFFSSDGGSSSSTLPQQQQHPPMPALQVVMVADDPVGAPPAVVAASPARPKMQRPDSRQKLKLSAQRSRVASTAATAGFPVATAAAAAAAGLFAVGSPGGAPSSVLRTPSGDFRLALSSEQTPSSAAAASVPGRLAPIVTHSDTFVEASGAPSSVVP